MRRVRLRQVTLCALPVDDMLDPVTATAILSWVIPILGGFGTYLARDYRIGWAIGLATQVLWITLGVITGLSGIAASALWFGAIQFRNWKTFKPRVRHRECCAGCACGIS